MIDLLKKGRAPKTILGLSLDGGRLEGALLRRTNGSLQVQKTVSVALSLNLLTDDAELVGREIRNQLEQNGIREKRCVIGLPLAWALSMQVKLPALPEADIPGFLEIEAERGFPYGPETLLMATSRCRTSAGEEFATLLAIPRNHLERLQLALKAAQLRPASFVLGITSLLGTEAQEAALVLLVGEKEIGVEVHSGGGVAALRVLDGMLESEGGQRQLNSAGLAREIRITLGQLPTELQGTVRKVRIFASGELGQRFVREMTPKLEAMGLKVESASATTVDRFVGEVPPTIAVSPALSAGAEILRRGRSRFEFLPPKVNPWMQLAGRFSSRKLAGTAATAGAIALIVIAAFSVQQMELSKLESKWATIEPKKTEVEEMQGQIRKFRPWFDESFRSLSIFKKLAESFPEDGAVSVKTVEIREPSMVACTGTARDSAALTRVLDQLRSVKQVADLKIDSVRGKAPLQFTFNFHWLERGE